MSLNSRGTMNGVYQVWCDVGGTFTDCFVVTPENKRLRLKVLSHGRMPGSVERPLDATAWIDPRRIGDPDRFWVSSSIQLLDANRQLIGQGRCVGFC
ncbi:MAG: hypothetical protein ACKOAU_20175, partial [Pirellula sp.]